ncbi:MAG: DUF5683 domain-containing protein [Ignavibacteria bacterium]|jgi:hypothetical protein
MDKLISVPKGWIIVFFFGTVINLMTVPFLFAQEPHLNDVCKLKTRHSSFGLFEGSASAIQNNNTLHDSLTSVKLDTVKPSPKTETEFKMKKSPWLAVLFSVVPGMGQLYNQSYWKVPILLGLTAYLGYEYYDNNKTYRNYRDQYSASQITLGPLGDPSLQALRNFYRDQRDDFVWYFALVYLINFVDAYVDAQLFDFDVKQEKIITSGRIDRQYKLNFHLNF